MFFESEDIKKIMGLCFDKATTNIRRAIANDRTINDGAWSLTFNNGGFQPLIVSFSTDLSHVITITHHSWY